MARPVVMIVDDDEAILLLMEEILAGEGYQSLLIRRAEDALATAARARPSLVILDIRIEGREAGLQILNTLRSTAETARIPVIVFTADRQFIQIQGDDLRARGYPIVEKPFDIDDLLATIKQSIGAGQSEAGDPGAA